MEIITNKTYEIILSNEEIKSFETVKEFINSLIYNMKNENCKHVSCDDYAMIYFEDELKKFVEVLEFLQKTDTIY